MKLQCLTLFSWAMRATCLQVFKLSVHCHCKNAIVDLLKDLIDNFAEQTLTANRFFYFFLLTNSCESISQIRSKQLRGKQVERGPIRKRRDFPQEQDRNHNSVVAIDKRSQRLSKVETNLRFKPTLG
ncbi:uncharacterized protein BYT42DRAFT_562848 [Radiomyces spectabilis]|uniref:uncharacterized protein n=1 Tax=Radiomyces spectabilis TaxID=64574 RepID=UPI002220E40E|nr:uncharacterized protein BYT42DRAFT_562848 [Radiomyces spectabilis]KAI8384549.1 hypothetical protein BYT42DRAFT_562848 [Radiomyces spectabilis]